MHTRYRLLYLSIVDAPSRAVAYNIAKMHRTKIYVALLPVYAFFGSIVARGSRGGGYSPPIGMSAKMQNGKNTTFLALLSLFHALEWTK